MGNMSYPLILLLLTGYVSSDGPVGCDLYDLREIFSQRYSQFWVHQDAIISYSQIEMCIHKCYTFNFLYSGIDQKSECLCTNKTGPWRACTDSDYNELKVYKSEPKDASFVGCYADRHISWKPDQYQTHDVQSCKKTCKQNNYLYASLRGGQECQCINMPYFKEDKSILCNITCNQSPDEVCGGRNRLSVYESGLEIDSVVQSDVRYIGCYFDIRTPNPGTIFERGPAHSAQECTRECMLDVYKYAAIRVDNQGEQNYTCYCIFQSPWSESPLPLPESQCVKGQQYFRFYFTKNITIPLRGSLGASTTIDQLTTSSVDIVTTAAASSTMTANTPSSSTSSSSVTTIYSTDSETSTESISPVSSVSTSNVNTTISMNSENGSSVQSTPGFTQGPAGGPQKTTEPTNTGPVPSTSVVTSPLQTIPSTSSQEDLTRDLTRAAGSASTTSKITLLSNDNTVGTKDTANQKGNSRIKIDDTRIIIGVVIAAALLVVIIIFIVYVVRRASRRNASHSGEQRAFSNSNWLSGGKSGMVDKKYSKPIFRANLNDYVTTNMKKRQHFKDEYKILPSGPLLKSEVGRRPEHLQLRNRFKNIIPYDETRVVLTGGNTDYINASYMKNYHGQTAFIATQGPKDETVIDFWQMIWQENVPVVVMLTEQAEARNECANYWPASVDDFVEFGSIRVSLRSENKFQFYSVRNFHVYKNDIHRTVMQFQYTDWPDHGVPEAPSTLVNFYEDVQRSFDSNIGPCVAHCAAGVGRTGTFIALDYLLDQAKAENKVDVMACVYNLRKQRLNIVQTSTQYTFLHLALNHMLTLEITCVPVDRFMAYFQSIRQITSEGFSKLEEQYKMLEATTLSFRMEDISDGLHEMNRGKNRSENVIPRNHHRPGLETNYPGGTGYINAVVLDCYTREHAFLVTQTPLHSTRTDMWSMIHDFGASVVLALDCQETDFYWPIEEGSSITYSPFTIRCNRVEDLTSYITKYQLEVKKHNQALDVTLLYLDWRTDDVGPVSDLLQLHAIVHSLEKGLDDIYPIVVQCKTGYERSGLYCIMSNAIKMLKAERRVDVYQCVQTARTRRPQFIKSLNQYRFIHDAVKVYISKQ